MLNCDVIIVGGGIAGLWTLNRLRQAGYHAILLEKNALGAGQTIASQGIIHGGIKYALSGEISESSRQISDMPQLWQACLRHQGEVDLSAVQILSSHYYLCSQQKITQKITQFFAQKALQSDNTALLRDSYPDFFQHPQFKGLLTQVQECVLDVPSLIAALAKPMMPYIFKIDDIALQKDDSNYRIQIKNQQDALTLQAQRIVLTAGEGNEALLTPSLRAQRSNDGEAYMQRRPLQMVMLTADNLPEIYVHCVELSTNPVLTVTSHKTSNGKRIWYLGGQLAEDGVHRDKTAQIAEATALIAKLFPWFTPQNPSWDTLFINRAEGFNHGKRPESVMIQTHDNLLLAWPTKLTFAPLLADKILQQLPPAQTTTLPQELTAWPKPEIAQPIWEHLC